MDLKLGSVKVQDHTTVHSHELSHPPLRPPSCMVARAIHRIDDSRACARSCLHQLFLDELLTIRAVGQMSLENIRKRTLGAEPTVIVLNLAGVDQSDLALENSAAWRSLGITEPLYRSAACVIGILSVPVLGLVSHRLIGSDSNLVVGLISIPYSMVSKCPLLYAAVFALQRVFGLVFHGHRAWSGLAVGDGHLAGGSNVS